MPWVRTRGHPPKPELPEARQSTELDHPSNFVVLEAELGDVPAGSHSFHPHDPVVVQVHRHGLGAVLDVFLQTESERTVGVEM
jgi:hypothetical protein